MKLIIQIPCLNEEATLPQVLADLPAEVPGFDEVEVLVIDDGSTDRTVEVARDLGVHHIASLPGNKGLARAFAAGLDIALRLGADVIVNTDGDNQYRGQDIPKLTAPILAGEADIVIGDRETKKIPHFSWTKKRLQRFGSWVVRRMSGAKVPDATSGFRAYSRESALRMNILSTYSYTLESIIQAARKGLRIGSVPIRTNRVTRKSRLMRSTPQFVLRSGLTILRISIFYRPLRFFFYLGLLLLLIGGAIGIRFLVLYLQGGGSGHIQSLILASILLLSGFLSFTLGIVADLIAVNRRLIEDQGYRLKRIEFTFQCAQREGPPRVGPGSWNAPS